MDVSLSSTSLAPRVQPRLGRGGGYGYPVRVHYYPSSFSSHATKPAPVQFRTADVAAYWLLLSRVVQAAFSRLKMSKKIASSTASPLFVSA